MRIEENGNYLHRLVWMDFSSSSLALLVGWKEMKVENSKIVETQSIYKCYSSVTQEVVSAASFDFQRLNFACRIKASYIPCNQLA